MAPSAFASLRGKRVLLTGHTGFKGAWLALWLGQLGAKVTGIALPPQKGPGMFRDAGIGDLIESRIADINDVAALERASHNLEVDLIIHAAAQAYVRLSYDQPAQTFMTNVMGTAHVLDLARRMPSLAGVIVVTSDKCYENAEWPWGYREIDPMGGKDPYSASKGCAELLTHAYRRSFFADPTGPQIVTVRAGNVFGGGDWGQDRLLPDVIRAQALGQVTTIRNPDAVRPWQHVLEPLAGYLTLAQHLLGPTPAKIAGAWNFGPDLEATVPVAELAALIGQSWGQNGPKFRIDHDPAALPEAGLLRLDSTKARTTLGWQPRLTLRQAVDWTTDWYRRHADGDAMQEFSLRQIELYTKLITGSDQKEPEPCA